MPIPNAKELKKLAKACREAGIHYFKSADFEFTLTGIAPPEKRTASKSIPASLLETHGDIETDTITNEELLFWSSGGDINTQAQAQTQE